MILKVQMISAFQMVRVAFVNELVPVLGVVDVNEVEAAASVNVMSVRSDDEWLEAVKCWWYAY